jgi:tRNA(Ile)-lysidine synthase
VADTLPDAPLLVALSGGADSAALALIAASTGATVRAVTIDHGLAASGGLVAAARAIAAALGLEHEVIAVAPVESEAALREERLAALERSARTGEVILTGHTSDDQAETVLGNLLRGAGTTGLSGIPTERGPFLRPLLGVPRHETRALATAAGLPFTDDPDNADPAVRRSRLRTVTIPALERDFNPALRSALAAAATASAADDRTLEVAAEQVPVRRSEEAVLVPVGALVTLPEAVASRVVRRALRVLLRPYAGLRPDVEAVLEVARRGGRRALSGDHLVVHEGALLALHPVGAVAPPRPVTIDGPGAAAFGPWRLTATKHDPSDPAPIGLHTVVLPAGPLTVRAALPGDVVALVDGSKRVVEALREAGVPERLRPRWPVVEQDGTIVWVVGARVAPGPSQDGTTLVAARREDA